MLVSRLQSAYYPSREISVDETIIPFKGRSGMKVFEPNLIDGVWNWTNGTLQRRTRATFGIPNDTKERWTANQKPACIRTLYYNCWPQIQTGLCVVFQITASVAIKQNSCMASPTFPRAQHRVSSVIIHWSTTKHCVRKATIELDLNSSSKWNGQ